MLLNTLTLCSQAINSHCINIVPYSFNFWNLSFHFQFQLKTLLPDYWEIDLLAVLIGSVVINLPALPVCYCGLQLWDFNRTNLSNCLLDFLSSRFIPRNALSNILCIFFYSELSYLVHKDNLFCLCLPSNSPLIYVIPTWKFCLN